MKEQIRFDEGLRLTVSPILSAEGSPKRRSARPGHSLSGRYADRPLSDVFCRAEREENPRFKFCNIFAAGSDRKSGLQAIFVCLGTLLTWGYPRSLY